MSVKTYVALELFAIGGLVLAVVFLMRRGGPRTKWLMLLALCGTAVENAGYILELLAPSMERALLAVKLEYLGSIFVPLLYCCFVYRYCNEERGRLFRKLVLPLAAIDLALLGVVFTCDRHTLFYKSVEWLPSSHDFHYLELSYGTMYGVCMLFETMIPFVASLVMLIRAGLRQRRGGAKGPYWTFAIVTLVPLAGLLAYEFKLADVIDLTPLFLALSLTLVAFQSQDPSAAKQRSGEKSGG